MWELIVLYEALELGDVEYEPGPGRSPDIRLTLPGQEPFWIEVAFLYPRFWREERVSRAVPGWILLAARRFGVPAWKLSIQLDGDRSDPGGPIRSLPELHDGKVFQRHPELVAFFKDVQARPSEAARVEMTDYSIVVSYRPGSRSNQPDIGGLVQEAPRTVREHSVFRLLCAKAKRHRQIEGARVVAIGSDQSTALSPWVGPLQVRPCDAVYAAFGKHRSLSAACLTEVRNEVVFHGLERRAHAELYVNEDPRCALSPTAVRALGSMNFNRWAFGPPLEKSEPVDRDWHRTFGGQCEWSVRGHAMNVKLPISLVCKALAGETSMREAFGADHQVTQVFEEGWAVSSLSTAEGSIEEGEAGYLELELVPPSLSPYWPKASKS